MISSPLEARASIEEAQAALARLERRIVALECVQRERIRQIVADELAKHKEAANA